MTRTEHILNALAIEVTHRRGNRVWAYCPYHDPEGAKSASAFFVRTHGARSGQHHCFACKKGGTLLDLVMHVRKLKLAAAKQFLESAGQDFEPPKLAARVVRFPPQIGRAMFRLPLEVICEPLPEWISPARRYATERCRLTAEEVDLFQIGYAVDGTRLACRIVLPWLGAGRIVAGYSARTYIDDEPKYQTPHLSEHPDRAVMFGEHLWPLPGERKVIAVTEGALNALAVRRACPMPIGAIGGSEIDPLHITKLATFERVLVVTDPDAAGNKAAERLRQALSRYAEVRRVALPRGKDALDIQRDHGLAHLARLIDRALAS